MSCGLVIISGATGFIGRPLALDLAGSGYEIAVLTRNPQKASALFGKRVRAVRWATGSNGFLGSIAGMRSRASDSCSKGKVWPEPST